MGPCFPYLTPKLAADLRYIEAIAKRPRASARVYSSSASSCAWSMGRSDRSVVASRDLTQIGRLSVGVEIFGRITPIELSESDIEAA